ncbi:hypothetical protein EDB92DRAFT_1808527 [Lactarius akahatsu]|uniref:Uncharacterized protein n=1 Tax=Lactarius akahatsu TaxID=416441 RepID=A0AAD4L2Q3_9AGAM|nr:hypothetical protein EDB92DRAFT_1808527 [Lactarius akahatsu]
MDHAFTGTYVQCFCTNDPLENISCPCGEAVQDAEHIICECPRFIRAWIDSGIYSARPGRPVSLPLLQSLLGTHKGIGMLLVFLNLTCTLSAPETSPPLPMPPEPD